MRREIRKKIGGFNYTIKELNVYDRNVLLFEMLQILGSASPSIEGGIKALFSNLADGESLLDIDLNKTDLKISESIQNLLFKLEPKRTASLIEEYVSKSLEVPNLEGDQYNEHFTKYYSNQFLLVYAIVVFNFSDSCEELKKKFKAQQNPVLKFFNKVLG